MAPPIAEADLQGYEAPWASWSGSEFPDPDRYTYALSAHEIREVNNALAYFRSQGLAGEDVGRANFPLPTLGPVLEDLAAELHDGRGFFTINGLRPDDFTVEDNLVVFLGISSYIADLRGKQDDNGYMIAHVQEAQSSKIAQNQRPFRDSNLALSFHNDGVTDIIAFQMRRRAAKGGNHIIAPVRTICEALNEQRPDLLDLLKAPIWQMDDIGRLTYPHPRPLLFYREGRAICNFFPAAFVGNPDTPRPSHLPPISAQQHEALAMVQKIAERHQLAVDMEPGSLTFINNFAVLHSREAFEDDHEHSRYLVRLWLKNSALAWSLPKALEYGNSKIFFDEELPELWNVVPQPRVLFRRSEKLNP
ncbi:hypothetical protein B0T16DRAFT_458908 [Cercophora newfieldiana]|uniref:TauD/TfdA-like domain-containing protein n=1 Tax=Cercophora newfieldiana TaxID=92897 RepID=A0AA40CS14_9PEZI|nr:hypothetical protein B0T16DRAFT_458908 [Cercophora newfieldiana]